MSAVAKEIPSSHAQRLLRFSLTDSPLPRAAQRRNAPQRLRRSKPAPMSKPTKAELGSGTALQVSEEPLMLKWP